VNLKGLLALLSLSFILLLFSCTKINEATELGGDLIPAVDNVNTFDTLLTVETGYFPFNDSSKHLLGENMALGKLNDDVFGTTTGDMYFNLSSDIYGTYPFINGLRKDSVFIDSVVLSLAYQGSYGDTITGTAAQISVQVLEIARGNDFYDTTIYRFDHPGFTTTGPSLGSTTFTIKSVKDSQTLIRRGDTSKVANVLRIPLNNSLGEKLKLFDTAANGAYKNDSLFRDAFRGLAVKTTNATGKGALAYFNLSDGNNSRLIVYYRATKNGVSDTTTASFRHVTYSQANSIKRIPGGAYLANLGATSPQNLYIQSSPSGSYVGMKIPGLDAFPNKVIHRAELIAYKVSDPLLDNIFTVPGRLFLDHKGSNNSRDSAYMFENDLVAGFDGSLNFASFGGALRSDDTYRFNITRYVQGIVTRQERNDSLRLYAPLRTNVFVKNLNQVVSIPILSSIAYGRVVLASGNLANGNQRLRLRIIYSNL